MNSILGDYVYFDLWYVAGFFFFLTVVPEISAPLCLDLPQHALGDYKEYVNWWGQKGLFMTMAYSCQTAGVMTIFLLNLPNYMGFGEVAVLSMFRDS